MTQTAIFTDSNNRVTLMHYQPEQLTEARRGEAATMVERSEIPDAPDVGDNQVARLYFSESKGFEYKVEDRPPRDDEEV